MAKTHGHSYFGPHYREYRAWVAIKHRCNNPRAKDFPNYGGRGIRICSAWEADFAQFLRDVGPRPSDDHSIDRIDNDGHYKPGNVRWATRSEQMRNRRPVVYVEHNGESRCLADWARSAGLTPQAFHKRLRRGWSFDRALGASA